MNRSSGFVFVFSCVNFGACLNCLCADTSRGVLATKARAGLAVGDTVTAVNGWLVLDPPGFGRAVRAAPLGEVVVFEVRQAAAAAASADPAATEHAANRCADCTYYVLVDLRVRVQLIGHL